MAAGVAAERLRNSPRLATVGGALVGIPDQYSDSDENQEEA